MSKLATLFRLAGRAEPARMGFATVAGKAKSPEMLIAVTLAKLDADAAASAAKAGADLILIDEADIEKDAEKIRAITAAVKVPCGLRLPSPAANAGATARELGLDFLRFEDREAPAAVLTDEEMGFVLAVADDATDTALRLLQSMPFDAIFAGTVSQPFTIRRQLELRRVSGFAQKPLLVQTTESLAAEDLECLRDSGVAAILIDGGTRLKERLAAQRQAIETMRPRHRRRGDRDASPTLPSISRGSDDDEEDD